jgi:hypothetical protein
MRRWFEWNGRYGKWVLESGNGIDGFAVAVSRVCRWILEDWKPF